MARRKKSYKTKFRTSSSGKRPHVKRRSVSRSSAKEKRRKTESIGGFGTVVISLAILLGLMIYSSNRDAWHKSAEETLTVHYIDVGQGDCICITCGGETMLIDCGEASEAENVRHYLNKAEIEAFDFVVATHPHSDHMGGMAEIVESYDIGEFIMPSLAESDVPATRYFEDFLDAAEEKGLNLTSAEAGRKGKLGDARWEIVAPISDECSNTNNYSVGIVLYHGENSFIFTGDAEASAEEEMVNAGLFGHIDVYKVGHHGSKTSSSELFMDTISPDIAVISCGSGNSYGHPDNEALNRIPALSGS